MTILRFTPNDLYCWRRAETYMYIMAKKAIINDKKQYVFFVLLKFSASYIHTYPQICTLKKVFLSGKTRLSSINSHFSLISVSTWPLLLLHSFDFLFSSIVSLCIQFSMFVAPWFSKLFLMLLLDRKSTKRMKVCKRNKCVTLKDVIWKIFLIIVIHKHQQTTPNSQKSWAFSSYSRRTINKLHNVNRWPISLKPFTPLNIYSGRYSWAFCALCVIMKCMIMHSGSFA